MLLFLFSGDLEAAVVLAGHLDGADHAPGDHGGLAGEGAFPAVGAVFVLEADVQEAGFAHNLAATLGFDCLEGDLGADETGEIFLHVHGGDLIIGSLK